MALSVPRLEISLAVLFRIRQHLGELPLWLPNVEVPTKAKFKVQ
jgi:hypothetical protein